MGDIDDEQSHTLHSAWAAQHELAERYDDLGYPYLAAKLRAGDPPRTSVQGAPMIIDTDIGGDPDDAIAVTCAARNLPELAAVVTTDEFHGQRARFARHLLDLNNRADVPVTAGADLGNTRYHAADGLTPDHIPEQPTDLLHTVRSICASTDRPVRWVGMGPMSNLSRVLRAAPELSDRLVITQMGGALSYRNPDRAEHNFRLDPDAARHVVANAHDLLLVISDVTFTDETAIDAASPTYHNLAADAAPDWARLLHAHLDQWFTRMHPASMQHDPLALSAALQLPFVDFSRHGITLAADARMIADGDGHPIWITTRADYPAFRNWLDKQLRY